MAYGIGSVIGDIDQKVDTYRNNPEALAQMYQQNQQLIDLLALQKLKTEKEAAMRDMQMKMQTPAASIKDQREQEVMGMMRNEVAQQVAPGLQVAGQQAAQAAAPPVPQGGGLQSLPAPNMQGMGMAEGGIVAFAGEGSSQVKSTSAGDEADADSWLDEFGGAAAVAALYGDKVVKAIKAGGPAARAAASWLKANASRALPAARTLSTAAIPAASAVTTYNTPTEQYAERFGFDPNEHGLLRDLGIRGLGAASDLANVGSFGLAGKLFRDKQNAEARRTLAVPATEEISDPDNEANVAEVLGENIRPTPPPSVTQAATSDAGIRAALPKSQAPLTMPTRDEADAIMNVSSNAVKEADAIMNVSSNAVKQAPPEVQNEYTRRLGELRGEQESKLEALIAFLQGAGGKTSFAATMSGGAAGMNAREQQIENEIMATVDKIEGLKLKQQEMGVEEDKVAAMREGNVLQAGASRYNADRDYDAAMAQVDADNYNTLADYQAAMAKEAASSAKAINDAIEKQQLTTAQRLELFASFDENLAADVRAAIVEQLKEKGESTPDSSEGQKIIQDGVVAARNDYVLARISDVAQSYGGNSLFDAADAILGR